MFKRTMLFGFCASLALIVLADTAEAQIQSAPRAPNAPGAPGARDTRGRSTNKPFANVDRGSTISPYLGLLRDNDFDGLPAYYAFVRPQTEQQSVNRQQQRNIQQLGREVQQLEGRNAFPTRGSLDIRETGHITRFMNFLHYYPK
jgi:hypothetical protein